MSERDDKGKFGVCKGLVIRISLGWVLETPDTVL